MQACLSLRGITKCFGSFSALNHISLDVQPGEVLALLGENGAGKSTLMNIIYGLYQPTAGQILLNGQPVTFSSPLAAISHGIGMVHQHFMLVPAFTVAENVAIGQGKARLTLRLDQIAKELQQLAARYHLQVDPFARVADLPVGLQQQVEILKALHHGAKILILDEPTGVLTPKEITGLIQTVRSLAAQGTSVIFISHKLNEVLEISDRIVVLRQGQCVGEVSPQGTTPGDLARMMVGRDVSFQPDRQASPRGEAILVMDSVRAINDRGVAALQDISLAVHAGEIVGIAGVDGNGQTELAEIVTGLRLLTAGEVVIAGENLTNQTPLDFINQKVGHVPEDRKKNGSIKGFSLWETAVMKNHGNFPFSHSGILNHEKMIDHTQKLVRQYDVRMATIHQSAHSLSGGNLQKLILAREITATPKFIVVMHPTRGLDVGAIEFVHSQLLEARRQGAAILLISSELEEVMSLADRILILYEGKIVGQLLPDEYDPNHIGLLMAGAREAG
ncbi:ABC transporter ATP-binding protein [Sporomusa malonica]|uniref:Nucleoside ABC transporter ATP-binding protein n=1 Tax=Sporomusa malonica TaxID=112901 RepID=A0A1W1Y7Y0_9FIRM|nr:ABC transporter ATP-binding protein [Sporomusa malonica]SMC32235.1 nucleoside ABC transporter ATP-binding protein [Sporomusa malonica]